MIATAVEIVIACLLVLGASLTLIAALGLFRLPDLFTRMHASSKAGTAGSGLLLLAVAMQSAETATWLAQSYLTADLPFAAEDVRITKADLTRL